MAEYIVGYEVGHQLGADHPFTQLRYDGEYRYRAVVIGIRRVTFLVERGDSGSLPLIGQVTINNTMVDELQ